MSHCFVNCFPASVTHGWDCSVAAAMADCAGSIRENIQLRRAHRCAVQARPELELVPAAACAVMLEMGGYLPCAG